MALTDETRRRLAACSSATLSTQLFKHGLRNQPLPGTYPPNAATKARYEEWKRKNK